MDEITGIPKEPAGEPMGEAVSRVDQLIDHLERVKPLYASSVRQARAQNKPAFDRLGAQLCAWAVQTIGDAYLDEMVKGYIAFVSEVNRSQARYQRRGHYRYSSFAEVFREVYDNPEFMGDYHWGVYTTTFAWAHHLALHGFFESEFLSRLPTNESQTFLDLGSGSGVWSFLSATALPVLRTTGVDISKTSVEIAQDMARKISLDERCRFIAGDALKYQGDTPFDAGVSCFLLEHLETPSALLNNLASQIRPHGYAFVTGALTAAEIDHIFEFRRESEVIAMAEEAGFRVIASMSLGPENYPTRAKFLPRSMAMVLQRRAGEWW